MYSSTVENYLKAILLNEDSRTGGYASMGVLAEALEVSPGTVTTMAKAMAGQRLLMHKPRHGVKLTSIGRAAALRVLRKHRLVETFLVTALKMDWAHVHEEAEALEHVVSDRVLERMDELLGHPEIDPHGDPIPNSKGQMAAEHGKGKATLASCKLAGRWLVARIHDQAPAFLDFVQRTGLKPGAKLRILRRDDAGGVVTCELKPGGSEVVLGLGEAAKIEVVESKA